MEENLKKEAKLLFISLNIDTFNKIMKNDNQWLLMTYYCPTHGSDDRCEPLQISENEFKKVKNDYHNKLTKNS